MPDCSKLTPWRCPRCNRLLMRLALRPGSCVEVVCERCGTLNTKSVEACEPEQTSRPNGRMLVAVG